MGLTREWDPVDRGFRSPGSRRVQVPYKYPKLAAYREAPKEPLPAITTMMASR